MIWVFPAIGTPEGDCVVRGRAFRKDPDRGGSALVRNARSILGAKEAPGAELILTLLGRTLAAKCDGEGFFALELSGKYRPLPLGRHEISAAVAGNKQETGRGTLTIVAAAGISVVSDFDDTIAQTHVTNRKRMVSTALFREGHDHPVVPGMAALYRGLARATGATFHYVSGSPVGFFMRTQRFLEHHQFPTGSVVLRHYETEPLESFAFKLPRIEAVARALPGHRLLLVGDAGEKDPEVYADLRARFRDRVAGVWIRQIGAEPRTAARFHDMLVFDRASEAAAEGVRLGCLDAAAVEEVKRAEGQA